MTPPATLEKRLYRIAEAQHILSIGKTQIHAELRAGRLQSVGTGKARRIPAEAIDAYIDLLKQEAEGDA